MTTSTMAFDWSLSEECPDGMYSIDVNCEGSITGGGSDTLQYSLAILEFSTTPIDGTTNCSWSVTSDEDTTISASTDFLFSTGVIAEPPVITALEIDCTACGSGENYTVNFEVTDATSCSAGSVVLPPGGGSPGSLGTVQLIGEDGSFTFNTAGVSATVDIQITVDCDGPGGSAIPDNLEVYMAY